MPSSPNPGTALVDAKMRQLLGSSTVAEAARYHLNSGGGKTRAQLALDASFALGLPQDAAIACACTVELLHNASLVHDDLQENDLLRRGQPAVWHQYGAAMAICTGDLMISAAFASLADHPRAGPAMLIVHDAITRTAAGQIDDLTHQIRTLASYRAVVAGKTGPLLALPVRLALCAAVAPGDEIAVMIGDHIAFAYQALDDLLDRDDDQAAERMNICLILESTGTSPSDVRQIVAYETRQALTVVRALSARLPSDCGTAFQQIADRLAITFMEHANAA
ncbi:polyprenyl synthetase family protein [Yoonia sp.]|uniref:polyprenyl synthetase family protein n=1 Tax=Yoonia sp. TaxID=2212373 RepID=UPI003976E92C